MNYIALIRNFWKVRRRIRFTDSEADLYFCLLEMCNEADWENPLPLSNVSLMSALQVSEEKLSRARNGLKQKGMIDFEGGEKNKRSPVYEIFTPEKTGKSVGKSVGKDGGKSTGKSANIEDKPNQTKPNETQERQTGAPKHRESLNLEELQTNCQMRFGISPSFTEKWYWVYEPVGWIDKNGHRILEPEKLINRFWFNGKQEPQGANQGANNGNNTSSVNGKGQSAYAKRLDLNTDTLRESYTSNSWLQS